MQREKMDMLEIWLPLIGGVLLGGFAGSAWYGGNKVLAIWLAFAGVVCFMSLAAFQLQERVLEEQRSQTAAPVADGPIVSIYRFVFEEIPRSATFPGALEIRPILKNSGRTPALNLTVSLNLSGKRSMLPDDFDYADTEGRPNPHTAILASGQELEILPLKVRADYVEFVRRGDAYLFLYGWIEYDDAFEGTKRHRTEFCWRAEVTNDAGQGVLILSQYGSYNCIDKGCRYAPDRHPPKKPGNPTEYLTVLE